MTVPTAPDPALRDRIIRALDQVPLTAGIRSRVPYGRFADAVLDELGPAAEHLTDPDRSMQ